jgi:hypothetical protein
MLPTVLLELLLWHPAGFSALEIRVWYLAASGVGDVGFMADLLGVRRISVSRAQSTLREHNLVCGAVEQCRDDGGKYEGFAYEALDEEGKPFAR